MSLTMVMMMAVKSKKNGSTLASHSCFTLYLSFHLFFSLLLLFANIKNYQCSMTLTLAMKEVEEEEEVNVLNIN